ncbi:hypothetical protein [Streptomyces sp. S1D4-20]|uniref:hypothetical protein n=1 Tax=Streptomyces sp. S1D4-20 TaxID=2594462 RepID=UPI0013DF7751|nr:hypothetical protein [Streptomyces sp. S1D4-20]
MTVQEPTSQADQQPSPALTPQPNQILAVPATVENCRTDYQASADVRQTMAQQDAKAGH